MPNFAEALNTKAGDIERPPLPPIGHYTFIVEKMPSMETIADGRFDVVDFQMKVQAPMDDVDEDELKAYGNINDARMRHRFMFNTEDQANFDRSLFNLKRFLLDHLQIDGNDKTELKELLNNSINQECVGQVRYRADKTDPEVQYAEIGRTSPVE